MRELTIHTQRAVGVQGWGLRCGSVGLGCVFGRWFSFLFGWGDRLYGWEVLGLQKHQNDLGFCAACRSALLKSSKIEIVKAILKNPTLPLN